MLVTGDQQKSMPQGVEVLYVDFSKTFGKAQQEWKA
jgi:hypothetical protein